MPAIPIFKRCGLEFRPMHPQKVWPWLLTYQLKIAKDPTGIRLWVWHLWSSQCWRKMICFSWKQIQQFEYLYVNAKHMHVNPVGWIIPTINMNLPSYKCVLYSAGQSVPNVEWTSDIRRWYHDNKFVVIRKLFTLLSLYKQAHSLISNK